MSRARLVARTRKRAIIRLIVLSCLVQCAVGAVVRFAILAVLIECLWRRDVLWNEIVFPGSFLDRGHFTSPERLSFFQASEALPFSRFDRDTKRQPNIGSGLRPKHSNSDLARSHEDCRIRRMFTAVKERPCSVLNRLELSALDARRDGRTGVLGKRSAHLASMQWSRTPHVSPRGQRDSHRPARGDP